jgi:hypothetical protein
MVQRFGLFLLTTNKQVCASCHHQYQPALAYRGARDHGVPFDESVAVG